MARGINKVILVGNLGADPEIRYMPTGGAVANLTIATSESWTDKQTNEKKEQTEWHRVVIYQRLAEIAGEYLRKGSKVYIEGRLRTRKWQDQQGVERYTTEIIANELQMLDGKPEGNQQPVAPMGNGNNRAQQQVPKDGQPFPNSAQNNLAIQGGYHNNIQGQRMPDPSNVNAAPMPPIDFDDDIPFAPIGLECRRMLHSI